ncbi:hypothetical protein K469DRAFT_777564 [Zopfia rhizophila CBS 207.26]|uniref:Mating-type alpha-pheromone receptor PreB n=1 Tax=Zopfia rhizophila CBS 207.26 TaxID=1314779 RepID=A0A6A6E1B1_9PEZI|nr:hypothetical protein K469DRAFT_777564 [Zopfia rhizophila CBS 207.26]
MSNAISAKVPPDFDPFTQVMPLLDQNGEPLSPPLTMADFDFIRQYGSRLAIVYGSQVGASLILFLVLLLLTKREKYRSLIFVMNATCLLLNTIRSALQCCFLTGPFWHPYAFWSNDWSRVTASEKATSITAGTMTLLLVICIMISLNLQVHVVCITTSRVQRFCVMLATSIVAIVAIGFRFAVTVVNNIQIMNLEQMESLKLVTAQHITQAAAIWFFCSIFSIKLGYALVQRRKLGITQFGPMQIIFIMGCQSMIIPAIFTCLQFYEKVPELGSVALTLIAINLPLSAIWAGISIHDAEVGSSGPNSHRRLLQGQLGGLSPNCSRSTNPLDSAGMEKEPESPTTPYTEKSGMSSRRGIRVEDRFSVETDDGLV